jgi:hypothetical protein
MPRWLNEEQATVNTGILYVTVTLSGKFLSQVRGMLVLNIFHNGVPTGEELARPLRRPVDCVIPSIVIDLITVSRCVDNV